MANEKDQRRLLTAKEWVLYKQNLENMESSFNKQMKDKKFLKLFENFIVSKEAYAREINSACRLVMLTDDINKVPEANQSKPGPRKIQLFPDLSPSTDKINFELLSLLRRSYERSVFQLFSYNPNIKSTLIRRPSKRRAIRGYFADASVAQFLTKKKRVDDNFKLAQKSVEAYCHEVWERYKKNPDPKALLGALRLAQESMLDNPVVDAMSNEAGSFAAGGSK